MRLLRWAGSRRLRLILGLGVMLAALTGSLAIAAEPAAAGWNGQQVVVHGLAQYSVRVCGQNNNNQYVCTGFVNTPTPDTPIYGYWWKGTISIDGWTGYNGTGAYLGRRYCDVPTILIGSDWVTCVTGW